jgi:dihydropteroate synthase
MSLQKLLKKKKHLIMGVLNVTPDSFSDGGQFNTVEKAYDHALQLIDEGADIIDIGGESSRPGATPVSFEDEMDRVLPVVKLLKKKSSIYISVDTYKSKLMQLVLDEGVDLINDIKALTGENSLEVIKCYEHAMVCMMHMQGDPLMMQNNPSYEHEIHLEIIKFFKNRLDACLQSGISLKRFILDPGFGFGKTFEHNWKIFQNMDAFTKLNYPLLIGLSRKSMLKKIMGDRQDWLDEATGFFSSQLVDKGPMIIRTHNVTVTKKYLEDRK